MRYSVASSGGAASFAGASQLNTSSAEPWKVHSAAAAVMSFFGLDGLRAASAPDAARLAEAPDAFEAPEIIAPDAAKLAEAPNAFEAPEIIAPDAAAADEATRGALATCAADADAAADAATSEAATTCSMEPSTTTREPSIPAPVWAIFSVSDDVSASLLRIICSHASEFL